MSVLIEPCEELESRGRSLGSGSGDNAMKRGPSVAGDFELLFLELVDVPLLLPNRFVSVRAIVLLGVGGGCGCGCGWGPGLGCDFGGDGCSRLYVGMLAIGGGLFVL